MFERCGDSLSRMRHEAKHRLVRSLERHKETVAHPPSSTRDATATMGNARQTEYSPIALHRRLNIYMHGSINFTTNAAHSADIPLSSDYEFIVNGIRLWSKSITTFRKHFIVENGLLLGQLNCSSTCAICGDNSHIFHRKCWQYNNLRYISTFPQEIAVASPTFSNISWHSSSSQRSLLLNQQRRWFL